MNEGISECTKKEDVRRKIICCFERADKLMPHKDSDNCLIELTSTHFEQQSEDIDNSVLVSQILQEFHVVEEGMNVPHFTHHAR